MANNLGNVPNIKDSPVFESRYNEYMPQILYDRVPNEVLNYLKTQINSLKNNFSTGEEWNKKLAGQIQKEYRLKYNPIMSSYIQGLTELYLNGNNILNSFQKYFGDGDGFSKLKFTTLDHLWVNFQEKYEYNPPHNHSGFLSFVIWYQIPYYYEDEIKAGPGNKKGDDQENLNGCFSFFNPTSFIDIGANIKKIDKRWEGIIAMFPAQLNHTVYPFYSSDDYRITVAGNIGLTV